MEQNGTGVALRNRRDWVDRVDALLARAETLVGAARVDDAPLAERIELWVDIVALRTRLQDERVLLADMAAR